MKIFDSWLHKAGDDYMSILRSYNLASNYGLFRRMTGTEGREELFIYGSFDRHEWKLYEFRHKPTRTNKMPTQIAPHQPRLDWQMWFSALNKSPSTRDIYLNMLVFRLLSNSKSVLELLEYNPFPDEPPQYIKINKMIFAFTDYEDMKQEDKKGKWWRVVGKRKVYLSPVQKSQFSRIENIENYPVHALQRVKLSILYVSLIAIYILTGLLKK
jgi:hypothetical protein